MKYQGHPLLKVWVTMRQRCYNPKAISYPYYGGRGIGVCPEWREESLLFYTWAIENGWKKGLELDRIDNEIGYSPDNCRFVSNSENARNRRSNVPLTYDGQTMLAIEWSEKININYRLLINRLHRGWTAEKALSSPISSRTKASKHTKIVQMDEKTGLLIRVFRSTWAAKKEGFCPASIHNCVKGKSKTYLGFKWASVASLLSLN
jgi:hypothetical protein